MDTQVLPGRMESGACLFVYDNMGGQRANGMNE